MALLANKTALITGGLTGIGFATARRFIEEGARVIITGRRQSELDSAIERLGEGAAIGIQGDASNARDLDRVFVTIANAGLSLNILFANSGIFNLYQRRLLPKITSIRSSTSTPRVLCSLSRRPCLTLSMVHPSSSTPRTTALEAT